MKTFLSIIGGLCVLVVLLVVGVAVFSVSNKNESQNQPSGTIDNGDAAAVPALSVTAPQLFDDYQANEVRADNKYKGKRLAVRGMVMEIRKDFTDSVVIALGPTNEIMTVDAHLAEADGAAAANLQKGQIVNLLCDGDGMVVGSPQLATCSFDTTITTEPKPTPTSNEPTDQSTSPQGSTTDEAPTVPAQPTTTPSQPTATPGDNNNSPAPIIRQPPPDTQPQS